jgi:predicted TPR repeat methyltransferase
VDEKKLDVDHFDNRLARVYTRTGNAQQRYDEWAATYESDLVGDMDYVAHKQASEILIETVPDNSVRVLDVACGTGLVGMYMRSRGYLNIDGVVFSKAMLAIAGQRDIYQSLWQHDFTVGKILEDPYQALICVGLFAFAVPKISDMHNVVNCVTPGGHCVITVNGAAWQQLNLEPEVRNEAKLHGFTIENIVTADYIREQGIDSRVLIIKR